MAFPISPRSHGMELVKVKVGRSDCSQEYFVHKSLLCQASPYFSAALSGNFSGAKDCVTLSKEHPLAFDVLYHYLYSGKVEHANFYVHDKTRHDLFWLRVIKLADATMINHVLRVAYDRLRELFSSKTRVVPSSEFVNELYDVDTPQNILQDYVVAHAVYWNDRNNATGDWRDWALIYRLQPDFALAVAYHHAQVVSNGFDGCKGHPTKHASFDKDIVFPVVNMQQEMKEQAEARKAEVKKAEARKVKAAKAEAAKEEATKAEWHNQYSY